MINRQIPLPARAPSGQKLPFRNLPSHPKAMQTDAHACRYHPAKHMRPAQAAAWPQA